jgi:hypothetical protein
MRPTLIREAERLYDTTADKWVRQAPRLMSDFVARRPMGTASTWAVARDISAACWRGRAPARSWALTCRRR